MLCEEDGVMGRPGVYPDEFRERAVRLVHEWRNDRAVSEGGLQVVSRVHRRPSGAVRGRADLRGPADRPFHLLRSGEAATVAPAVAR